MTVSRETNSDEALLAKALEGLGVDLDRVVPLLLKHWQLVESWGSRTNLTAITSLEEAAWLHYRDSLASLPFLPDGPLVDLGSGAGFPGIPLAIVQPTRPITLLEAKQKKCSFLEVCCARLGLAGVTVRCGRMQAPPADGFAVAVTRATFSDEADLQASLGWLEPGGVLLAYRSLADPPMTCSSLHDYELRGQRRTLAKWVKGT